MIAEEDEGPCHVEISDAYKTDARIKPRGEEKQARWDAFIFYKNIINHWQNVGKVESMI